MTAPLVSIVVNNYNYARFLRRAVDSALAQTYPNIEVLVVDDGSTDESPRIISEYGNRIVPILKTNGGQASAMNAGFARAKGEWISYLDADDALLPECIDHAMNAIRDATLSDLAKCHWRLKVVDENDSPLGMLTLDASIELPHGDLRPSLRKKGTTRFPPTTGNLFSRATLAKILPMPEEEFRLCADAYLCTASPLFGNVLAIDQPLGLYRAHGNNRFSRRSGTNDDLFSVIRKRATMFEAMSVMYTTFGDHFDDSVKRKNEALALMARLALARLEHHAGSVAVAKRITSLTCCNPAIPVARRITGIGWSWITALLWDSAADRAIRRVYGGKSKQRLAASEAGPVYLAKPAGRIP